jgi:hypothetical protein
MVGTEPFAAASNSFTELDIVFSCAFLSLGADNGPLCGEAGPMAQ